MNKLGRVGRLCLRFHAAATNIVGSQKRDASATRLRGPKGEGCAERLALVSVAMVTVTLALFDVPENVSEEGWKVHVESAGNPVQENCTAPA